MKRIPLSTKQRFRILKRDQYTCQYCGRCAPRVKLVVDHVVAVVRGGTNEESNLVTACFECNAGKSAEDGPPMFLEERRVLERVTRLPWERPRRHSSMVETQTRELFRASSLLIGYDDMRESYPDWESWRVHTLWQIFSFITSAIDHHIRTTGEILYWGDGEEALTPEQWFKHFPPKTEVPS